MLPELRHALRSLSKSPTLTIAAVLSLGLGLGLNLTVFGVFESLFLRGVTAVDPAHTFHAWVGGTNRLSYPNYRDLRDAHPAPWMAAYSLMQFTLGDGGNREKIYGQVVTGDYFEMLGVRPRHGRLFAAEEKSPERAARVVLLAHSFWQQRFGGNPANAIGQTLRLNAQPFTIIGILPEGYRSLHGFATEPPFYAPYSSALDSSFQNRSGHPLELVLRTAPTQTEAQASASLLITAKELARLYPGDNPRFGQTQLFGITLADQLKGQGGVQRMLVFFSILSVVVGLILLLACSNVAGLLTARAVQRRKEMAVRLALGGTRADLSRLFLTDGALLALAGLAVASFLYVGATQLLEKLSLPIEVPFHLHPELNWRIALYSCAIATITTLVCSAAPVLEASRANLCSAMKTNWESSGRGRFLSLRNSLLISQVAVSLLLLVTSLLFVRSLNAVQSVQPGFNVDNQLLATLRVDSTSPKTVATQAEQRLAALPGVRSVSQAWIVPLSHMSWITSVEINHDAARRPIVQANVVGERYFTTMGVRLLAGREFSPGDTLHAPAVAIVNQTFVARHLDHADPLGQIVSVPDAKGQFTNWIIVGVVADSKHVTLGEAPTAVIYRPTLQEDLVTAPVLHIRTEGPAMAMLASVRTALQTSFPQALVEVKTMGENITQASYPNKIGAALLGGLGTLGLILASVGLYGSLAYAVSRRAREIGVRMALGAHPTQVLRTVLGQTMTSVAIGMSIGISLAFAAAKPMTNFLADGVTVADPVTLGAVVATLGCTGALAAFVPARQALRVDPMETLRAE